MIPKWLLSLFKWLYERRVSRSRCYETTTVRWFGQVTAKRQAYLGGKSQRREKATDPIRVALP